MFGHTLKPWIRAYGGVLFVNCGSVGSPRTAILAGPLRSWRPRATVRATIERFDYDAESVARQVRAAGLPTEYADGLLRAA